jgi:hypothetical protein
MFWNIELLDLEEPVEGLPSSPLASFLIISNALVDCCRPD